MMCSHTILDKIRNEVIREKIVVTPIEDKMREARLRRSGRIKRRDINVRGLMSRIIRGIREDHKRIVTK